MPSRHPTHLLILSFNINILIGYPFSIWYPQCWIRPHYPPPHHLFLPLIVLEILTFSCLSLLSELQDAHTVIKLYKQRSAVKTSAAYFESGVLELSNCFLYSKVTDTEIYLPIKYCKIKNNTYTCYNRYYLYGARNSFLLLFVLLFYL